MKTLPGAIAWGCWRLEDEDVGRLVALLEVCHEHGIQVIDTAPVYGYGSRFGAGHAERMLGLAFNKRPELRQHFVVVTKAGLDLPVPYDSSHARLMTECETSRKALGDDTLDVYLIHRPDLLTAWRDLAESLDHLVSEGKVRKVGVSNFTPTQVDAVKAHLEAPLFAHQVECSTLHIDPIQDGTLDQIQALVLQGMAWSPLAGGRLFNDADDPVRDRVLPKLQQIAEQKERSVTQIALSFLLNLPRLMPIVGSMKPERIIEAATAASSDLDRGEWYDIMSAARGAPMP
ncbi:MAG: aldo/keto reductase [Pseudomonadota bacterium]